jgi:hypothetical protein
MTSEAHGDKTLAVLVGEALGLLRGVDKRQDDHGEAIKEVCEEVAGVREELKEMNGSIRDTKVRVKAAERYASDHAKFHASNVPIATRQATLRAVTWVGGIATAGGAVAGSVIALAGMIP